MMNIAIFVSGEGSNMIAIIDYFHNHETVNVALVLADRECNAINTARDRNIKTHQFDSHIDKKSKESLIRVLLKQYNIDLICLAGYMSILSPKFCKDFENKIINIHPSLLPKYKGLNTHKRVLKNKDILHGCSVHYVTEKIDEGKVIDSSNVPVLPNDTVADLEKRVKKEEHKLYPIVIEEIVKEM